MKTQIKVSKKPDLLKKNYPALQIINDKFEVYLPEIAAQIDNLSHIYICGPPAMNKQLV
jgi:NAD(P)H-flavin reductase